MIASFIFVSTFFKIVSSRIPNFACRLESVRITAFSLPTPICPCFGLILFMVAVRFATCASAASNRAVSSLNAVLFSIGSSGVLCPFYWCLFWTCSISTNLVIYACRLSCVFVVSVWRVAKVCFCSFTKSCSFASRPWFGINRYSLVSVIFFSALFMCKFIDAISSLASKASVRF